MDRKLYLLFVVLFAVIIVFIIDFNQQGRQPVPNSLNYGHTNYTNCRLNPDYPFQTEKELKTIRGKVREALGSKMYPWRAAKVNGSYLFNPETGYLIDNFEEMKDETIEIRGYPGKG